MAEKVGHKTELTEDYGAKPVPVGEGKGWFGIGMVYWGIAMCLPLFFLAGLISGNHDRNPGSGNTLVHRPDRALYLW